ncbi:MAG: toprim domain-containing protein [Candidatus Phytoplasma australasiaticum]|nr:toprim domain-containing protein [Candidatus Phytoplasma australasiaticum]
MNKQIEISDLKFKFPMLVLLKKLNLLPPHFPKHYRFPCPIHQGKNPTCCHINEKNCLHCWKCGRDFDTIQVYQIIRGVNFRTAIKRMANFMQKPEFQTLIQKEEEKIGEKTSSSFFSYSISPKKEPIDETTIKQRKKKLFKEIGSLFNQISHYYHQALKNNNIGMAYLTKKRGLSLQTIQEFKLGYAPPTDNSLSFEFKNYAQNKKWDLSKLVEYGFIKTRISKTGKKFYHDAFQGSIIIPIENGYGKTFHFYQNHFQNNSYFRPKYQALTNFSQTPTFHFSYRFFEALPFIKQKKTMIIHEGFFDVISAWQIGVKNAVGLICVAQLLSQAQIAILQKEQIKVIIALDNDETGRQRSQKLGEQLQSKAITFEIRPILAPYVQNCKDADDLIRKGGLTAYQKSFLEPLGKQENEQKETKFKLSFKLAKKFFGENKIQIKDE